MRIVGERDDCGRLCVLVDGHALSPARSQRVWNHSPTGFECGYGGSGPAQLALAILLKAGLSNERACHLHQAFKWEFITPRQAPFDFEIDVRAWANDKGFW